MNNRIFRARWARRASLVQFFCFIAAIKDEETKTGMLTAQVQSQTDPSSHPCITSHQLGNCNLHFQS